MGSRRTAQIQVADPPWFYGGAPFLTAIPTAATFVLSVIAEGKPKSVIEADQAR
jgi:hypothetical protein